MPCQSFMKFSETAAVTSSRKTPMLEIINRYLFLFIASMSRPRRRRPIKRPVRPAEIRADNGQHDETAQETCEKRQRAGARRVVFLNSPDRERGVNGRQYRSRIYERDNELRNVGKPFTQPAEPDRQRLDDDRRHKADDDRPLHQPPAARPAKPFAGAFLFAIE